MGVIIGATSSVSFGGDSHATQISWNINPNIQRAYVLGAWGPYKPAEVKSPTEVLNISIYSPGPSYSTEPTEGCFNAETVIASVSPAGCGGGSDGPTSNEWYVTSYSFSKGDARTPGTESWSMMNYVTMGDDDVVLPTYVLRGISEGSISSVSTTSLVEAQKIAGIDFEGEADIATEGSVSAGQIGQSSTQFLGVIKSVGGSSSGSGDIANGSCSMPYTPMYL